MRYGLISNFRRSWSRVGERTIIASQQSFDNRYLFSAVSPLSGESFHLISVDGFDSDAANVFLMKLKEQHPGILVVLVWDNAPCHRVKIHREIPGMIVLFLPPYSPELNPTERFFEELRKATANQIFTTIEEQEVAIEERLNILTKDPEALQRLVGYPWILEQCRMS